MTQLTGIVEPPDNNTLHTEPRAARLDVIRPRLHVQMKRFTTQSLFRIVFLAAVACVLWRTGQEVLQLRNAKLAAPATRMSLDTIHKVNYHSGDLDRLRSYAGPAVLRVVDGDGIPVGNVKVSLTLIGPDGGDGGFEYVVTNAEGVARSRETMQAGRYQYGMMPPPNSKFKWTNWKAGSPYITMPQDDSHGCQDLVISLRKNAG